MSFSARLASLPDEKPCNDVWALVRVRTKPKVFRPLAWLQFISSTPGNILKKATAAVVAVTLALLLYGFILQLINQPVTSKPQIVEKSAVTVKWSDDPLGNHTDAMVKFISNM